ncbi:MAG: FAD-binding oxidoreductase [Albidovulum sp.]
MGLADTYYSRTADQRIDRPALIGAHDCDTAIVGGGLSGLTTAIELARAGHRVVVLDAQSIGFGASGRNGGIVSPHYACGEDKIERRVGLTRARELHRLSIEGVERVRANIADLGLKSARPEPGILHLRRFDRADDIHAHAEAFARDYDYPLTYLDRAAIRDRMQTDRYFHGLLDAQAFHIHPLNYLHGLARGIEALGSQIFEGSEVIGHRLKGPQKLLTTGSGTVSARHVVFATGGYTGALMPQFKRAILPIATYMTASEAAPDLIASAIRTREAIFDDRRAGDYYRVFDNGQRLLWGGRITTRAASPDAVARILRREMIGVFPQLKELKTEIAWSGLMGYARHQMPQIGQYRPGVWHATGFGGHGLNTTAIAGTVVSEAILGQSDRIRQFAPFGLDWAGGPLGLAAAQLSYWSLQAQDWWRERA